MFSYHGGMLWIDFINTQFMHQGKLHDQLQSFDDLLEWSFQAGDAFMIDRIRELLREHPNGAGQALLHDLRSLRFELRKIADHINETGTIPEGTHTFVNERLKIIAGTWRMDQMSEGYGTTFVPQGGLDGQLQWPILDSFVGFLSEKDWGRLKICGNHECIQYFYDTSKNSTRRWCRMEVCGNREKAKRHYRKKGTES